MLAPSLSRCRPPRNARAGSAVSPVSLEALELAKPESLQLAGLGPRQLAHELDRPRVLVRRDGALDEVLQLAPERLAPFAARLQHDEGLDDFTALAIRRADHRAFADGGVREQRAFDLRPGDVVAGTDDHVIGACL